MLAQRKAEERQQKKERPQRFTATVQVFVEKHLKLDLSPEQIVGVARKESVSIVSHERIYQHIWLDKKGVEICMNTYEIRVEDTVTEGQKKISVAVLEGR